jgi:hypothetical protein
MVFVYLRFRSEGLEAAAVVAARRKNAAVSAFLVAGLAKKTVCEA